jgi:ribosomal protein L11 methyltransferase
VIAFVLTVDETDVELASDALWALGVVAVEERSGGAGTVELWTALGDDLPVVADAAAGLPAHWAWRTVEVDEGVADTWRLHAMPTWVDDDLVVCPSWIDAELPATATVVHIDPGPTFGMGDHPTTVSTMQAMRRVLVPGVRVLDVGCGSGVLAIAAVVLGAAQAVGIDISPAAEAVTHQNATRNGVADRVQASSTPLEQVAGTFDLVLANILAPALVELADHLVRVTGADGTLVISGVLADRHDHVLAALAPLVPVHTVERDGWAAVTLRRP